MIDILCALLAIVVVAIVMMSALMGWGARVTACQRWGLCTMASGLVLAAPSRYAQGVSFADLMFLGGLCLYLLARNIKFILRRADALDGVQDGRLVLPPTRELIERVRRVSQPNRR